MKQLPNVLKEIQKELLALPVIDSIKDISKDQFVIYIESTINIIKQKLADNGIDYSTIKGVLEDVLFLSFTRKENMHGHSGIAVFGYGKDEIYPSLYRLKIYGVVCGKLKWYIEEVCKVTNSQNGFVCPMAQSDVMMTVLKGIEPKLQQLIEKLTTQVINNCTLNKINSIFIVFL